MKLLSPALAAVLLFVAGWMPRGAAASSGDGFLGVQYRQRILRDAESAMPSRVDRAEMAAAEAMWGSGDPPDRASRVPPAVAFLMSAAIPGAGQLAEGRNRAFAYLGVEVMSWVAHYSWKDAGDKKEGEYQAYARQHWNIGTFTAHAVELPDSCKNALPPGLSGADALQTLQGFIESKNWQHYYEDIGKLEAYRSGWDDFDCSPDANDTPPMSPHRVTYRAMREKSNDYLNKATSALTVAFLNRVVSAVDAYRTARGARLRIAGAEMKLDMGGSLSRPRAMLELSRSF